MENDDIDLLKPLSEKQAQLVKRFAELVDEIRAADIGVVGSPYGAVAFFNKENAETIYDPDDTDIDMSVMCYEVDLHPYIETVPIECDALIDDVDGFIGIKFKSNK